MSVTFSLSLTYTLEGFLAKDCVYEEGRSGGRGSRGKSGEFRVEGVWVRGILGHVTSPQFTLGHVKARVASQGGGRREEEKKCIYQIVVGKKVYVGVCVRVRERKRGKEIYISINKQKTGDTQV